MTGSRSGFARVEPANEDAVRIVRDAVEDWLAAALVAPADRDAVRHSVVELVTNVVEHAYLDSGDAHGCTVDARISPAGLLRLRVTDQGRWRRPRPSADRGLGLQMARELMDTLRVDHDERGTTAEAGLRLTRPARLLTAGHRAARGIRVDPLLVLDQPHTPTPRIRLDGPIDAATTPVVHREVLTAGSTGTQTLTVDLTGVTHLASAGVAVLYQLAAPHRDNGTELRLLAPVGTTADTVLSLVELDHHTSDPDDSRHG